jgi:hypothetical protein
MLGLAVVKERLGHSDISTTQRYLHALPDADDTSLDAVSKIRNTQQGAGQAADSCARAARMPYARIPRRTQAGTGLRQAAWLLSRAALSDRLPLVAQAQLVTQLAALVDGAASRVSLPGSRRSKRGPGPSPAKWPLTCYAMVGTAGFEPATP